MTTQFNDAYLDRLVGAFLGSTEGTYYRQTPTSPVTDIRTTPVVSIGNSGLSYGGTQLDVSNGSGSTAYDLFESLLGDAVTANRITSLQASDYLARAAIHG